MDQMFGYLQDQDFLKYLKYVLLTGSPVCFSLEEDFVSWREQFWPAVCEHFGVEALGDESRLINPAFSSVKPWANVLQLYRLCRLKGGF